jgi:hypothetical protein
MDNHGEDISKKTTCRGPYHSDLRTIFAFGVEFPVRCTGACSFRSLMRIISGVRVWAAKNLVGDPAS